MLFSEESFTLFAFFVKHEVLEMFGKD